MLIWQIPSPLAPGGQFNSSCFNPGSRGQRMKAERIPLSDLTRFSPSFPRREEGAGLPSEGGAGRGVTPWHLWEGKRRGCALSASAEGGSSVSREPVPTRGLGSRLARRLHRAKQLCQGASTHCQAGNPAFSSPKAWKLSSTRQLSVLKEYTDLTFLRSHRRLIS